MKAQRSGVILLTSSVSGLYGNTGRSPYCAAKWGVNGLMKTRPRNLAILAIWCARQLNLPRRRRGSTNEVVLAREAALKGTTRECYLSGYASGTSMRSFIRAADIAAMAVFLASDAARFVSGQISTSIKRASFWSLQKEPPDGCTMSDHVPSRQTPKTERLRRSRSRTAT
jgi:NAD(P)-dependent dehydrogenase (short-subunit alcohol dehydrogenase family)